MFTLPDLINPEYYRKGAEVSAIIIQSGILAFLVSSWVAVVSFRASLQKHSTSLMWLGVFASCYAIWNILFLSDYAQRDIPLFSTALGKELAEKAHLAIGLSLPYVVHSFICNFFGLKQLIARYTLLTIMIIVVLILLPSTLSLGILTLISGLFIFGSFALIIARLTKLYATTEDLKLKTRSFFMAIGLIVCTSLSVIGQLRADGFVKAPLPYLGNIFTAAFLYFVYQMVLNPRLREVRELMLRGIQILLLTLLLSIVFITIFLWVGESDSELFVFNTFIASFIILSVLEPFRKKVDSFFLRQFIVDRYEFEQLIEELPKKLRACRTLYQLSRTLLEGIQDSGRIYQTALYLWEPTSRHYRLIPPSNLDFKPTLFEDQPLTLHLKKIKAPLLQEQGADYPKKVQEVLREMHAHIVLPLFHKDELLGLWALRGTLQTTNPYTSFSNEEVELLRLVGHELCVMLEQLRHFEFQEQQERLAALGEMSAALAHEIRNPLGAIQGATQLLETSKNMKNDEDTECVQILRKEIDRLQSTVNQYLNYARMPEQTDHLSIPELVATVLESVKTKAKKTQTEIHTEIASDLPPIQTDPVKIQQVLFNLLQNACEAFSKNVWLTAKVSKRSGRSVIVISVKDDGPGIPSEHLPNIFTPLFTTKKAGSGLGLPICKKIIDSLGGELTVQSKPGKGTTFKISFQQKLQQKAS